MTLLRHCERSFLCHPESRNKSGINSVEGSRPAFIWAARRSAPSRSILWALKHLIKRSFAPLTSCAQQISAPRGHDRCRGCAPRNNPVEAVQLYMTYLLYKKDYLSSNESLAYPVHKQRISLFSPFLPFEEKSLLLFLLRLYFVILSFGKFWIFYCKDNANNLVHTSYVIHSRIKFPFIKRNGFEIGPCFTTESFRNKGIYRNVLKKITSDEMFQGCSFFIIVHESNIPSKKGIEAGGFEHVGAVRKTFIKTYRMVNENS